MIFLWVGLGVLGGACLAAALAVLVFCYLIRRRFLGNVTRIFQEKPLFIIPRGQPVPGAEDVRFPTTGGLTLSGCYLKGSGPRRGVILFGLEFGSNRWACHSYCEALLAAGYDVFAFEPRGHGDSDPQPGYEPLQWVTSFEVTDFHAALAYLKGRPDADPEGVGFFGISKGASAGLLAAAGDSYVRCFVTDGMFATYTTILPYMRKWVAIYSNRRKLQRLMPDWVYAQVGLAALKRISREQGCRFPHLERKIGRLAPRPLFMIHGGADTYIKPEMARALFERAREPRELWLVEGAKHNQALHVAGEEYRRRVLEFFQAHLARPLEPQPEPVLQTVAP